MIILCQVDTTNDVVGRGAILMYCQHCGKEIEGETQFCGRCGAQVSGTPQPMQPASTSSQATQASPDLFTDLKRFTGKVVEKSVEVTGKVAKAAKPAVKKGYEVTKAAAKDVAKTTKKAAKKMQDKE